MKGARAFGQFWYDFIIGDDWKIAAGVVLAVALTTGLLLSGALGDTGVALAGALAVVTAFAVSLVVDVRARPGR